MPRYRVVLDNEERISNDEHDTLATVTEEVRELLRSGYFEVDSVEEMTEIDDLEPQSKSIDIYWESDFSKWMSDKLGKKWSIQQNGDTHQPYGQDEQVWLDVTLTPDDCEDPIAATEAWLRHETPPWGVGRFEDENHMTTDILLSYLCHEGHIAPGTYCLRVWW